jgi:phosphatidylethanolamine/phosphatidyl-N-methylethanolamine N-methyltransferase
MPRYSTAEEVSQQSRQVERVYKILARVYDDFFDWALGPGRRYALSRLPVEGSDRVLEVGVGTGLSLPLYPEGSYVTGIDISGEMLKQARARRDELGMVNVELHKMDARDLHYPDGSFDHVFAPYVMSVVPDPAKVMHEIHRVCKPGGTVLVVNHFRNRNPVLGFLERLFTPLTRWIGFRMDLPLDTVADADGFEPVRTERVNFLGIGTLVELRRKP